jgi:transcription elongation GreA/GreB family factor
MNKDDIDLLIQRQPRLESSREKLESMQEGVYCIHRSWGLGKITEYNAQESKLIIDFEGGKAGHAMDPVFCIDRLDILAPESMIARHRKEPEVVEEIIKKRPTDLIVEILSYAPNQGATNSELESQLIRLLGEKRYKKWWTATKKLLVKDPRVAVPAKKTSPYLLREEPITAEDEILEQFFSTKAPEKKVTLAEKLQDLSVSNDTLKKHLPDVLMSLTEAIKETRRLNPGERLHGLWIRNDLARYIHEDVEMLKPTSASMIYENKELSELAVQIPSSYLKRLLELIARCYPDDWKKIMFDLLKNSSGKFTSECINFLMEMETEDELQLMLQRWLDEQTLKGPILLWIIKNRHAQKFQTIVKDLITPRMLNAIFYAIDYEAIKNAGTRRIPLADFLSDDIEIIPELLSSATPETASDLATTLMLNQGFENLTRNSLLARFIKQFPNVQHLLTDDKVERPQEHLIVSQKSYDARKKEYDILITEKIPENTAAIGIARELGDIRENAEYKMARQDQDTLLSRKERIELDLARAQITDFTEAPADVVGIGTVVELLQHSTGQNTSYTILGAWDSDPANNTLSYETPLGYVLLSKRKGETVETNIDDTMEKWTIKSISRYIDAK